MGELCTVDLGGVTIAYRAVGAVDGPPMVLLHALRLDSTSWDTIAATFGDSYRVYALDMRGHGVSGRPGRYSFELMRDDVLQFLDALGLERVTLVGHSMGGSVAYVFAEDHSDRLDKLVVEDTAPPSIEDDPIQIRSRPDGDLPFDWEVVPSIIGQLNDPDPGWWRNAGRISAPTLIIAGGPESHVNQERIAGVADSIPNCRLATIPIGHHIHEDAPEEFIPVMREFLAE